MSDKKEIVVIDDDSDLLETLVEMLDIELECNIKSFLLGQEALDFLNSTKVDLILTDYLMPSVSGEDVTKGVRESDSCNKDTPVIILSGDKKLVAANLLTMPDVYVEEKTGDFDSILSKVEGFLA